MMSILSQQQLIREWRHNPCLMRPISAILLLVMGIFWLIVLVWKLPSTILTYIVITPLIQRFSWIIEFWYPTSIGKWLHLGVVKLSSNNKKKGNNANNNTYHSRFLETRLTIIPNRIYVHPIPQLLDNLGYLVVCLPPPPPPTTGNTNPAAAAGTNTTTSKKSGNSTSRQTSSGTTATATTTSSSTEVVVVVADETTPLDSNSNKNRNRGSRDDPPGVKIHIDPNANQDVSSTTSDNTNNIIVAFVVDCGDANAVLDITEQITKNFYSNKPIHIQSILSTHKHHDHTAGNLDMLNHHNTGDGRLPVKWIFGGAVENVPGCNYPLQNGDLLPLPKCGTSNNDMNQLVEVEAIATPAHTRGSITYILRPLLDDSNNANNSACCCCLFTGDTVFSAGGGVPFEADLDSIPEHNSNKRRMNANSYIHASASMNAIERCFAEVIYRSVPLPPPPPSPITTTTPTTTAMVTSNEQILVFPGHEYTHELLSRQFGASSAQQQESCKWKYFTPQAFFETVSHMYVTLHKRNLPSNTGKLLTIPSSLNREMHINPHFRTMKQRGIIIMNALKLWNRHFAHDRVSESSIYHQGPAFVVDRQSSSSSSAVTAASKKKKKKSLRSKEDQWNLDVSDINRNVFTTMYTTDLNKIIDDLASGKVDSQLAASRLRNLKSALDEPVLGRRPIPGTLPSSRNVYRGLLGLALLGSSPTAMTMSDAGNMKLPEPIDSSSSDGIRVSKKRLTAVLYWLGLLNGEDGTLLVAIIQQLWKETHEYAMKKKKQIALDNKGDNKAQDDGEDLPESSRESTDLESMPETDDEVELGALKWVIYGIPEQPPRSWFGTYCTPCSKQTNDDSPSPDHPAGRSGMNRHNGELVRHDVFSCPMCRDSTGCPILSQQVEEVDNDAVGVGESQQQQVHTITSSTATIGDGVVDDEEDDAPDDERAAYVEVSPESLGSMLMKDI